MDKTLHSAEPANFRTTLAAVGEQGARAEQRMLPAGERVGRYVLRKLLGEGGMGAVYLGYDPDLERLVALKILHGDPNDPSRRTWLLQEAKATARLAHPNVVGVHDVGTFGDDLFIALEYVHGWTLRQWLSQNARPWVQVLHVLLHAGRGLAAAHHAGLIHRDFKPENILLGQDGRVRVADFGLARVRDGPADALAGKIAGTPGYMAPEQYVGETVDPRSDQFAFAATAWEALAGERPFGGVSLHALVDEVFSGQTRPFPTDSDVPPSVIAALRRALSVDPPERYPDMAALLTALQASVDEHSTHTLAILTAGDPSPGPEDMPRSLGVRYRLIEPFAAGALGPVFRARDRLDGQVVAIKRTAGLAIPRSTEGVAGRRLQLARELQTRMTLRHPNLVGITDFGFDDEDIPFFVLDLPEGARPLLVAARGEPLAIQLHLIAQLLRALAYLHLRGRCGVPLDGQTVVVVGETLKVIDTDITALAPQRRHGAGAIAPELEAGGAPSPASDLWTVGALLLALCTRRTDLAEGPEPGVLSALQSGELRRSPTVDRRLAPALERLLAPSPDRRPASAREALALLAAATGIALPQETVHTRESFLQAIPLVGRDSELDHLLQAVRAAVRGRGCTVLVAGESGAGKSRLVEELRTLAVLHGAVVLRGNAVSEGGRLFEVWRPLLRWLAISLPLSDLEASVLRLGVPDIDRLLGREVDSAPDLDAESAQLRLLQTLLGLLRRQVRPVVVILDDLQWARSESVALLADLTESVRGCSLLVLGTYREDEAPRFADQIAGADLLRLGRLGRPALAQLATAMIGDAERGQRLTEFLARETEGNALFVVEIMRALGDEAGELERVGELPLPTSIAAGGVQQVIQRRLQRLSTDALRMLEAAAVIGRSFDLELLAAVEPGLELPPLLDACREAATLELEGRRWRFSHDKIRESLLEGLAPARARELHARVADAMVARHGRSPEYAESIAYHYRMIDATDQEVHFLGRAGEHALEVSPSQAVLHLERAIELGARHGVEPAQLVRWRRLTADACYMLGDFPGAIARARGALAVHGVRLPRRALGWTLVFFVQVAVQAVHLLVPPRGDAASRERWLEASRAAGRASQVYLYTFETLPLLCASLLAVNLAQRSGGTEPRSVGLLGYIAGLVGSQRLARRYFDEGQRLASDDDPVATLADLSSMRSVYETSRGNFSAAAEHAEHAIVRARRVGYALGIAQGEGIFACVDYYHGDLAKMHERYARAVEALQGGHLGHARGISWGLAWSLAELGRDDEAGKLNAALLVDVPAGEKLHLAMLRSLDGLLLSRRGAHAEAVAAADAVMRDTTPGNVPGSTPPLLLYPAEVYLAAWADARRRGEPEAPLARRARKQARGMRLWARLNPIGRAIADLVGGHVAQMGGDRARALRLWSSGLALAERHELRMFEARLRLALAEHGPETERQRHREAAERLLHR